MKKRKIANGMVDGDVQTVPSDGEERSGVNVSKANPGSKKGCLEEDFDCAQKQ